MSIQFFLDNPFKHLVKSVEVDGRQLQYYDLVGLNDSRYGRYFMLLTS